MIMLVHAVITNYDFSKMKQSTRGWMVIDAVCEGLVIGLLLVWACGV